MSRRKSNPKRRRSIGRFSPAMEQLEARRLLVGELLELQLSATRDGADLLDANRQLSLEVGERFDLEVRYADLRTGEQADGAFTLLTDIASDSPGAIVPVLRETQRLAFDQTIQTIAVDSVTFELEGSSQTEVVSFTTFESDPTAATIQALIAFGYQQSDFEVIRADSATQIILQVHYSGEQFGNIDLPNLSASVQETNPAENVATETIEIAPFNGDGSPNSNAVPFNIDTFNSSLGQIVYGNANGGTFDPNSGFVGVGGTGPIVTGGIPDLGTFVEPFFAYSLEVEVAAVTTNAGFSVAPGQSTESVLLYGQDNPLTPDLILLGAESQFVANFAAAPPAFTTNPTNPFDVNDSGTISLADGLQVANNLLAGVNSEPSGVSLDVNGDGRFSPNDLIAVLNEIERLDSGQGPAAVSGEVLELELDLLSVGGDSLLDASRIANVQAGDSIVVQLSYRDLRAAEDRLGALSVFADVLVSDASALRLPLANADFVDQITPATNYSLLGSPAFSTTLADTFDELGVLGPLAPIDDATGSVPVLSFTLVAESAASGLSFALDFPDEVDNEIQLYGAAAPLDPVNVLLGSSHAFTLNILDAASAPVANDDTSATQEDTVVTIDVLTNDVIPVGVDATLTVSGPSTAGGLLTVDGGQITYTPPVDFSGVDSFTYQVATANGNASAEVVVTVESVNDLPVVNDDPVTAQEDSILTLAFSDLLANDSDVDSVLSVTSVGEASNGSVTVSGETVTYAPAADFSGTDSFTYTVDDGSGGVVMGAVNVTVIEVNDAPLAIDDVAATNEDQVLTISAASLLVNDFDPDGAADTLTISSVSGGTGQVSLSGDTITYTPQADFVGSDTFTYEISDLAGATAFASVVVEVTAVNDAPVAGDDFLRVNPGEVLEGDIFDALTNNDSAGPNENDQTFSITEFSAASSEGGTVVIENGGLLYTPPAGFSGSDSFTYRITDSLGLDSDLATVSIDVNFTLERIDLLLAQDATNDITVRRESDNLVIVDNADDSFLLNRPIDSVDGLSITGAPDFADRILIDHSAGGLIDHTDAFDPGPFFFGSSEFSIRVEGGQSAGDQLIVSGTPEAIGTFSHFSEDISGEASIDLSEGFDAAAHDFTGFESITFDQMLRIELLNGGQDSAIQPATNIGAHELNLGALTPIDLGALTTIDGGTLRSTAVLALGDAESILANGTVEGRVAASTGSLIRATGDLTIGDAASPAGFVSHGDLEVGQNSVTLADLNQADLEGLVSLGGENEAGTLVVPNGIVVGFGANLVGHGTVDSTDSLETAIFNNGDISGTSEQLPITLSGHVKGVGRLDQVVLDGTSSPGFSPAITNNGRITYGAANRLIAELGGALAGSGYDQVNHEKATLGGILDVQLIDGFEPLIGQVFSLLRSNEDFAGAFENIQLPATLPGAEWLLTLTTTELGIELGVDVGQIGGSIELSVVDGNLVFIGEEGQTLPASEGSVALQVAPTDEFNSDRVWTVSSTEVIDGVFVQNATDGEFELRIEGGGWTNFVLPADVDSSGEVSALDALQILNQLARGTFVDPDTSRLVDPAQVEFPDRFYDANGDLVLSARDALHVINRIARITSVDGEAPLASLGNDRVLEEANLAADQLLEVLGAEEPGEESQVAAFDLALSSMTPGDIGVWTEQSEEDDSAWAESVQQLDLKSLV